MKREALGKHKQKVMDNQVTQKCNQRIYALGRPLKSGKYLPKKGKWRGHFGWEISNVGKQEVLDMTTAEWVDQFGWNEDYEEESSKREGWKEANTNYRVLKTRLRGFNSKPALKLEQFLKVIEQCSTKVISESLFRNDIYNVLKG